MSFIAASRNLRALSISARVTRRAARVAVVAPRASSAETTDAPTTTMTESVENAAVFFRGNSYTEAEFEQKKLSGEIDDLSKVDVVKYAEPPSFGGEFVWGRALFFSFAFSATLRRSTSASLRGELA